MFLADDSLFKEAFLGHRFSNQQAKGILRVLERKELGASAGLALSRDLTLEHVLPKRPRSGEWAQFSDENGPYTPIVSAISFSLTSR